MQRASQITKRPACPAFLFGFAALAFAEPLKLEIAEAKADRDQRTREPIVSIRMTKESSQAFAAITQLHLENQWNFALTAKW